MLFPTWVDVRYLGFVFSWPEKSQHASSHIDRFDSPVDVRYLGFVFSWPEKSQHASSHIRFDSHVDVRYMGFVFSWPEKSTISPAEVPRLLQSVRPAVCGEAKCQKCGGSSSASIKGRLLLCDNRISKRHACDLGWHMNCLPEPLAEVPAGKWVCPSCLLKQPVGEGDEKATSDSLGTEVHYRRSPDEGKPDINHDETAV